MNKYQQKHIITLSDREKAQLKNITNRGKHNARVVKRAHVLLKSGGGMKDADIASAVETSIRTVENIRARYAEGGLDQALYDAPRSGAPATIDDKTEAHLIAVACSAPPRGHDRWTLELLRKKLKKDKNKDVSTVAIWNHLNERDVKPWREKNVVHPNAQ